MKKMVALVSRRFGVERISVGDIFNVPDQHVVLYKALGWVKDLPPVKAISTQSNPELVPTPVVSSPIVHVQEDKNERQTVSQAAPSWQTDQTAQNNETMLESEPDQSVEYSRMLRERAAALGIRVDGRWSDTRVQREIDEYNKNTYQRADMRSTE
jgi:hypothetical protein